MIIPVVFATDNDYIPQLAVAINSLLNKRDKRQEYRLFVLYTDLTDDNKNKIIKLCKKNYIELIDVSDRIKRVFASYADVFKYKRYFKLFIPEIFYKYENAKIKLLILWKCICII